VLECLRCYPSVVGGSRLTNTMPSPD
jgi:hypothetical protein